MKKRILWLGLSFLLVAALVLTSCGEAVPGEQEEEEITPTILPEGMGIIKVYVTDPPRPELTSIEVVIDSIDVHKVVSGEPSEWIPVEPMVSSFDLVTLVGVTEFLGSVEVTAGSFTQIRVGVSSVEVNGEPATLPSGTLKIVRPFSVREGSITTLELDFDGERSVVITGKGKFIFKPVVRLQVEISGLPETGGDTTPPEITLEGVTESEVIVFPDTVTPVFSASDDTDLEPTVTATLNGEPFTSGTEVSEVGEYELEVTAIDASDNEAEVAVNFEIVEVEDTTPPVITLEGVTEGQVIVSPDTVTPVFSASDDTDPEPILIATLTTLNGGDPFASGTEVSEVGEYELEVTAIDASGNETEVAVSFEIVEVEDTTPPVIDLTGVTECQVIVSPDTVTPVFSVSDDTDPEPILIATLTTLNGGDPFTSGTEISEVGEYELEVTAIDASGNEADVAVNFEIVAE